MEIIHEDPRDLLPNPWNSNSVSAEGMRRLEGSLERHGWVRPVLARRLEDGTLEILGGQHRVEAAMSLGYDTVPVIDLGEVDDLRAKEVGLIDNARYGADDAGLLSEILDQIGIDPDAIAVLPFSTEELAALKSSVDVDLDTLGVEPESEETAPPPTRTARTHVVMRFKVPVEDADDVTESISAIQRSQGFTTSDSLTNAGDALVWAVRNLMETSDV